MEKMNLSLNLKNDLGELDKIKAAVAKVSKGSRCDCRKSNELNLILEELFANIVLHGFNDDKEHEILLSISCDESTMLIQIEDDGMPFDLTSAAAPDTHCAIEKRHIGGLGIHFVKHFMDDCKYYRKNNKNIIILKKNIHDNQNINPNSKT
jgi:anti-sigma regulatory factor (Ser/Thr protein kinase)